ncbi:MAG: glycyl-radical enzyme activating protein [Lachnospiraceae bacterium]|nr:glycyl-radical enzyme activating protein [Lachnospiraceae bacterium]
MLLIEYGEHSPYGWGTEEKMGYVGNRSQEQLLVKYSHRKERRRTMGDDSKGIVFDIQRYSIHDGQGIRTLIFMKGCPLRCLWCANPEGLEVKPNMMFVERLCYGCGRCATVCPTGATAIKDGTMIWDKKLCTDCMKCVECCNIAHARKQSGTVYTVDELLELIEKDAMYFGRSDGGVTFGGGEPANQAKFVSRVMQESKYAFGINTAVETSSYASRENAELLYRNADFIFTDIKHMDDRVHQKLTGVSNRIILDNIRFAAEILEKKRQTLTIRIPVIPGFNDTDENIRATAQFVHELKQVQRLELLPYHNFGEVKYNRVRSVEGYSLTGLKPPSEEQMGHLKEIAEAEGVTCKVGSL